MGKIYDLSPLDTLGSDEDRSELEVVSTTAAENPSCTCPKRIVETRTTKRIPILNEVEDDLSGSYLFVPDDGLDFRERQDCKNGQSGPNDGLGFRKKLYSKISRAESIAKWLAKRKRRDPPWPVRRKKRKGGTLKLSTREKIARSRPRVKGKFVKTSHVITAEIASASPPAMVLPHAPHAA